MFQYAFGSILVLLGVGIMMPYIAPETNAAINSWFVANPWIIGAAIVAVGVFAILLEPLMDLFVRLFPPKEEPPKKKEELDHYY